MGIASGAAELLLRSSNKIKFRGKLLQLGNQKILCSKNKFNKNNIKKIPKLIFKCE